MNFLRQLLVLVLFCFVDSGASDCFIRNGQSLHVYCDTNSSSSEIDSVIWKVTRFNTTLTLFNCNLSSCVTLNPSDLNVSATVAVDTSQESIVTSNISSSIVNITNYNLQNYSDLTCETTNKSFNICPIILIYDNPENVTCYLSVVINDIMAIDCRIYPSGQIEEIRIKTNNVSTSNESIIESSCSLNTLQPSERYYASECSIALNFTKLGPGNHQISVIASPYDSSSDLTISSNDVSIQIYGELQEPICMPPKFDEDFTLLFEVDCISPLPYMKVGCILLSRTNGTVNRAVEVLRDKIENIMDKRSLNSLAVKCHYVISTGEMGIGQHEFKVILTSLNKQGKTVTKSGNWTTPVNFYKQTTMNLTANGSPDGVNVSAGDNVTFHCNVNGYPSTDMYLRQEELTYSSGNWIRLLGPDISLPINRCQQAGLYTCSSSGHLLSYGDYLTKSVYVNIPCPIRLDSNRTSESNRIYAGTFTQNSHAYFRVFGYPAPTSMRLSSSDRSLVTDSVMVIYTPEPGPYGKIEITFRNNDLIRKLTNFTLDVDNGVGNCFFDFSIQADSDMSIYGSTKIIWLSVGYIMSRSIV